KAIEKASAELDKRRAAARTDKADKPRSEKADRTDKPDKLDKSEKAETVDKTDKPDKADKADAPVVHPEMDKPKADKPNGAKKSKKHDDGSEKPAGRSDAKADAKTDGKAEAKSDGKPDGKAEAKADAKTEGKTGSKTDGKPEAREARSDADARPAEGKARFTLQLSSFQDKTEAEAFLSVTKSAGYQPYLIEADVAGKGTFYRVRLGSYRSLEAANDAKAEYEK